MTVWNSKEHLGLKVRCRGENATSIKKKKKDRLKKFLDWMYIFTHILQYSDWNGRKQLCTKGIIKLLQTAAMWLLLGLL